MATIELLSRVGADGTLTLNVPQAANQEVKVTVEELEAIQARQMSPEDWATFMRQIVGSIDDPTFVRQPQGEYEDRGEMFP